MFGTPPCATDRPVLAPNNTSDRSYTIRETNERKLDNTEKMNKKKENKHGKPKHFAPSLLSI